jgi:hypothetical protein
VFTIIIFKYRGCLSRLASFLKTKYMKSWIPKSNAPIPKIGSVGKSAKTGICTKVINVKETKNGFNIWYRLVDEIEWRNK